MYLSSLYLPIYHLVGNKDILGSQIIFKFHQYLKIQIIHIKIY